MQLEISSKLDVLQSTVETVDKITRVTTLITGADCLVLDRQVRFHHKHI